MIKGYIRGKTRRAETREIKTTIYNVLRNTEVIGCQTMSYNLLIQRVGEHLEEIRLSYNQEQIVEVLEEMMNDDTIYRVTTDDNIRVGLTR